MYAAPCTRRETPIAHATRPLFDAYEPLPDTFDEAFAGPGRPRPAVARVMQLLDALGRDEFRGRKRLADSVFLRHGVTFSVYGERGGVERIFPFDPMPRLISAADWRFLERGLIQRVRALNAFLHDIYGPERILADRVIPKSMVLASRGYLETLGRITPPGGVHIHIAGIDLIRDPRGGYVILEDNVRTPSGVSYVLENRAVMKRAFPVVFHQSHVRAVDAYPARLKSALRSVSPRSGRQARIVILTPGPFNSAYFEHTFLARRLGCELVQGRDLFVERDRVYARTTHGPVPVDVIYRRIDDGFLDPEAFRADSVLGVPGLMRAYRAGNVTLANAPGNGVADDKAVYPFVPAMIKYYLGEDPIIPQVKTYICGRPTHRKHVLANIAKLVVKAVDEAGGYGMLVGPQATKKQIAAMREQIEATPRRYIAQPLVELSTCPTWTARGMAPRRVDLRPYVISGADETWVLPGGLTRVALRQGSYVVNSSQGGGSKDTWVLEEGS